jgi:hypothetical protein
MSAERDPFPDQKPLRDLYVRLMEELKRRRNVVGDVLSGKWSLPQGIAVELSYLQLRMICELIALSCLAAHGDIPGTKAKKLQKAYSPQGILTDLQALHPEFYPVPGQQVLAADSRPAEIRRIEGGYLTKDDLVALWAECGAKLHRGSFKNIEREFVVDFDRIKDWDQKILTLLGHHQIQLQNPDYQLWVVMQAREDGRVHAHLMAKSTVLQR